MSNLKRVTFRAPDESTCTHGSVYVGDTIGWFFNKWNPQGWVISNLDEADRAWLEGQNIDTDGIFRVASERVTSLAKFRLNTGTMAWLDNDHLELTDEIKWGTFYAYSQVFVDQNCSESFGI